MSSRFRSKRPPAISLKKKFLSVLVGAGFSCFLDSITSTQLFFEKRIEKLQLKQNGNSVLIDDSSKELFDRALKCLIQNHWRKSKADVVGVTCDVFDGLTFTSKDVDPIHTGRTMTLKDQCAAVGIPLIHRCQKVSDIDLNLLHLDMDPHWDWVTGHQYKFIPEKVKSRISAFIKGHPRFCLNPKIVYGIPAEECRQPFDIDWESNLGKELLETLLISDNAKMFSYAREMKYLDTFHEHLDLFIRTFCFVLIPFALFRLSSVNTSPSFLAKNRLIVLTAVFFFFFIGLGHYLKLIDFYYRKRDVNCDSAVASCGVDMANGGIEFYEKMLKRNKILRKILGLNGEQLFLENGNVKSAYLRKFTMPLTDRKHVIENERDNMLEQEKSDVSAQNP